MAFEATSRRALDEAVGATLGARIDRAGTVSALHAVGNRCPIGTGELWFCSYGLPLSLELPESDLLRVQVPVTGSGALAVGRRAVTVDPARASLSTGSATIEFGPHLQQIVWRIPPSAMIAKLGALTGSPIVPNLAFALAFDLEAPKGAAFRSLLGSFVRIIGAHDVPPAQPILAEMEQALLVAFLYASPHNYRSRLDGDAPDVGPGVIRRAESYIEAHWNEPLTIEALAEIAGTSARSLFRTFRQSRGCSPLDFIRRIRLARARSRLENEEGGTVAEIALACGFGNPGRFSKEFAAAYGELPSAVLQRTRKQRIRPRQIRPVAASFGTDEPPGGDGQACDRGQCPARGRGES
jgi:AraC-like DNA-binding protein